MAVPDKYNYHIAKRNCIICCWGTGKLTFPVRDDEFNAFAKSRCV
jgi:hypothetical protein